MRHLGIAEFCPVQPHGHQLQLDRKAEHRHGLGVGQVAGTDGLQRGGGRLVLGRALDRMLTGTVGVDAAAGGGEIIIQPGQRVGALATQQHLEVQVRAKNVAGGTAVADQLALFDLFSLGNNELEQVGVPGNEALLPVVGVADVHVVAVALHAALVGGVAVPQLGGRHRAVLCRVDRAHGGVADLGAQVDAVMAAAAVVVPALGQNVLIQRPAK